MPSGVYVRDRAKLFFKRVNKDGPAPASRPELGPCWLWAGKLDRNGYGKFRDGKDVFAHRWSYEHARGTLPKREAPDYLCLDHLCRTPNCVNPAHLELVSHADNLRRGENRNAKKTHCPKGHPYDEDNTVQKPGGGRRCRECARLNSKAVYRRRRRRPVRERISLSQVATAREMAAAGSSHAEIGKAIGVSDVHAGRIVNGRSWKDSA